MNFAKFKPYSRDGAAFGIVFRSKVGIPQSYNLLQQEVPHFGKLRRYPIGGVAVAAMAKTSPKLTNTAPKPKKSSRKVRVK